MPKTLDQLENAIKVEWKNVDNQIIENLASSFEFQVMTLYNRKEIKQTIRCLY